MVSPTSLSAENSIKKTTANTMSKNTRNSTSDKNSLIPEYTPIARKICKDSPTAYIPNVKLNNKIVINGK
ncbi:hypothetical protein LFU01_18580 [Lysinibacillus fusiformis]|nr:hypothetical protein LFU01_18580 [Lysinibacillus fusiformis]